MLNILKTISIFFAVVMMLSFVSSVSADTRPSFEILSPQVFEDQIVQLRAEYDSEENAYHPTEQPLTWFEFGTHPSNLEFSTPRKSRLKGSYQVTQGIARLQPDTIYYVQAVIKFDGDATRGNILSFNSSSLTPVIIHNPADVPTTAPTSTSTIGSNGSSINSTGNNQATHEVSNISQGGRYITANQPILSLDLFNFPNIFSWKGKKEKKNDSLLDTSTDKRELITYAERSDFENSATNDDGSREIIKSTNKKKLVKRSVVGTASVVNSGNYSSTGINYGMLFLVILMLVVIVIMTRITMRKRWRVINQNQRPVPMYAKAPVYRQAITQQTRHTQYQPRYSY